MSTSTELGVSPLLLSENRIKMTQISAWRRKGKRKEESVYLQCFSNFIAIIGQSRGVINRSYKICYNDGIVLNTKQHDDDLGL